MSDNPIVVFEDIPVLQCGSPLGEGISSIRTSYSVEADVLVLYACQINFLPMVGSVLLSFSNNAFTLLIFWQRRMI